MVKWSCIVDGARIWSITSLPSFYRDEFLNLCWYCLGGVFSHSDYYVVVFCLKMTDGWPQGAGNIVLCHMIGSVTTPISGCQLYQSVQYSKLLPTKEEPIKLFSCLQYLFSYTNSYCIRLVNSLLDYIHNKRHTYLILYINQNFRSLYIIIRILS